MPKTIGEPVGQDFLTDGRIVVLAMFGAGLVRIKDAKRRIDAMLFRVIVSLARRRHRQHVVAAVHDQVGAFHVFEMALRA